MHTSLAPARDKTWQTMDILLQPGIGIGETQRGSEKGVNENVMCSSPVARVNGVNHAIPISYKIHVRYSPGLPRACAVYAPGR